MEQKSCGQQHFGLDQELTYITAVVKEVFVSVAAFLHCAANSVCFWEGAVLALSCRLMATFIHHASFWSRNETANALNVEPAVAKPNMIWSATHIPYSLGKSR
jgi:hypothetical protein